MDLISIDESGKPTARELYEFLSPGDKSNYSRWAKTNIENNEFYQEGNDWRRFVAMTNGNETNDYKLTIEFAKHLCMLSRTERGKQARNYFIEVEKRYLAPAPLTQLEILAQSAQILLEQEKRIKQLSATQIAQAEELQGIRDVVSLNSTDWREDSKRLIVKMADRLGGFEHIQSVRKETYKQLNSRINVDIDRRLKNKRQRMADEGVTKSKRDKLNYLDIIAEDKKLLEAYLAIVKEMAIKYGVAS